jgi:hypothetical protein
MPVMRGLTRASMLRLSYSSGRMDYRIKSGNDEQ